MVEFELIEEKPDTVRIKVIGIGGAGSNAVGSMLNKGFEGVDFYVVNTDVQALERSKCVNKIQIGTEITQGLGAGSDPMVGEKAALAAKDELTEIIKGADMLFLTAGLGGGTGTGATPVIAELAREAGILTVVIVTRPFRFEGPQRMRKAEQGIETLQQFVDTMIVISNERLLEVVGKKATLNEAFEVANNVLAQGVRSIWELIMVPGLINVDFADVRTIMGETGGAVMGVGEGKGENRATEAVKKACSSPLLDKIVIDGAKGVLVSITGGPDMTLAEINEATTLVYEAADDKANIIFGAVVDESLSDEMRVTIIATGFSDSSDEKEKTSKEEEKAAPPPMGKPTSTMSLKEKLKDLMREDTPKTEEHTEQNLGEMVEDERTSLTIDTHKDEGGEDLDLTDDSIEEQEGNGDSPKSQLEIPTILRKKKQRFFGN